MYKDVWKKFGAKVLLVACSVLLLGGVAIAAPKLWAAEPADYDDQPTYVDRDTVVYPQEIVIDGEGIVQSIPSAKNSAISVAGDTVTWEAGGITLVRQSGNWRRASKKDEKVEVLMKVDIDSSAFRAGSGIQGNEYMLTYTIARRPATISVEINNKIEPEDAAKYDKITGMDLKVGVGSYTLKNGDFKITVDGVKFDNTSEYAVFTDDKLTTNAPQTFGSGKKAYILMDNYKPRNGSNDYTSCDFSIKRHILDCDVKVDGNDIDSLTGLTVSNSDDVVVKDEEGKDIDSKYYTAYETAEIDELGEETGRFKITVEGSAEDGHTCVGTRESGWYTKSDDTSVSFVLAAAGADKDNAQKSVPYDEAYKGGKDTYLIEEMAGKTGYSLWMREGGIATKIADGADGWDKVTNWGSASFKDTGATAGILNREISVRVNIDGKNQTKRGTLSYVVTRELADAKTGELNPNLRFAKPEPNPNKTDDQKPKEDTNTYTYDGKIHEMIPKMYFEPKSGESTYMLQYGVDYTVAEADYILDPSSNKWTSATGRGQAQARIDKGTVIMSRISGLGSYYLNTIVNTREAQTDESCWRDLCEFAQYEIESQTVSTGEEYGDKVVLLEKSGASSEIKEFPMLTTTKEKIIEKSFLRRKDGSTIAISTSDDKWFGCASTDVSFFYLGNGTSEVEREVTDFKLPGTYRVTYKFNGNYKTQRGGISCEFEIKAIEGKYDFKILPCDNEVNPLCHAESTTASAIHVYNGMPHKPQVQMYDTDTKEEIDSEDGTVYYVEEWRYEEGNELGKNAGTATVYIHLAGMQPGDEPIKKTFTIEKRTLKPEDFTFADAGFTGASGKQTYEYDNTIPHLSKLKVSYMCGDVQNDVEGGFTTSDFEELGLWNSTKTKAITSPDEIQKKENYYYKINLINNNYRAKKGTPNDVTELFIGPFTFRGRDINKANFPNTDDVPAVEYSKGNMQSKVEAYFDAGSNYQITDFEEAGTASKKTLKYTKDYQIKEVEDRTDDDGTVAVTLEGIGGYGETKTIILNVGIPITRAELYEMGDKRGLTSHTKEVFINGKLTLKGTYNYDLGTNYFGIDFDTTSRTGDSRPGTDKTYLWDAAAAAGSKYLAARPDGDGGTGKYRVGTSLAEGYPKTPKPGTETDKDKVYYALELTGVNGYYGKATVEFAVQRKSLEDTPYDKIEVKINDKNCIYRRKDVRVEEPSIEVWDNGVLVDPENYTIKFPKDMWSARPDAVVEIIGMGAYKDSRTETFEIHPCPLGPNPLPADNKDITEESASKNDKIDITLNYPENNAYSYVPGGVGVKPEITVTYTYGDGPDDSYVLTENEDYTYVAINNIDVNDNDKPYVEQPLVVIKAVPRGGFENGFTKSFRIVPYNLADKTKCELRVDNLSTPFTGERVTSVNPYIVDKNTNKQIPDSELDIKYENNYLVSKDGKAKVIISGRKEDGKLNNYMNSAGGEGEFEIVGDLSLQNTISNTTIVGSKDGVIGGVIPYKYLYGTPNLNIDTFQVRYAYKAETVSGSSVIPTDPYWDLEWKKHYNIFIGEENIIDYKPIVDVYQNGHITGTGCFEGVRPTKIVVQGDLSNVGEGADTQVRLKANGALLGKDDQVIITTVNAESKRAKDLDELISITCGKRTLIYGEDYIFAESNGSGVANYTPIDELPADLGITKTAYIIPAKVKDDEGNPTDQNVEYLTGACPIKYTVKEELTIKQEDVKGIDPVYQYKHGKDVIDRNKVEVTIKRDGGESITLNSRNGCEITFGESGAATLGGHEVIIKPTGNYSGTEISIPFRIDKYDLGEAYKSGNLKVAWKRTATYTGKDVYPIVHSVTAYTVSGTVIDAELYPDGNTEGKETAYILKSKEGENNTDFSNGKEVECILAGTGNYTGEVPLAYNIFQKNIEDQTDGKYDVGFEVDKPNYDYRNGENVRPKPEGTYNGMTFTGTEDNGDGIGSITGTDVPFIYSYPEDTRNVGKKTIQITGTGNYTGNRTLDYNIVPLDFAKTDLEFAPGEIVYDGTEQHPAFKLSYEGKDILSYDKKSGVVSGYIPKVEVKFQNAENATKEKDLAKVIIEFPEGSKDGNYTGRKIGEFAIQQASLQNHVKFKHHPAGEGGIAEINVPLKLDFLGVGKEVKPKFASGVKPTPPEGEESDPEPFRDTDLQENEVGAFYDYLGKENDGSFLKPGSEGATVENGDYKVEYKYVEPDSDDTDVKEGYGDKAFSYAGKVKVTITGINNYKDSASFWYFIGKDISEDGSAKLQPTTAVYNAQKQAPSVIVSGISGSQYNIARYKNEVKNENYFANDRGFVDAATYYIRLEGKPTGGTYATKPITLTYTITPRPISNSVVIDGFKKEYNYTGLAICPIGISVTDYIDRTKYKLTENEDYSLTYANNINVGTATINVTGEGNFKGTAAARFAITSSMISSGNNGTSGGSVSNGSGQISGAVAVAPDDVRVTLDAGNAMYYTGKQLTPAVTISGMTQNTDYTVTYSNNIEVGTGTITVTGMGNNTGTITKNFRIVAKLSDCKVTNIPDQQYTGSEVTPMITVTCGNTILTRDKDYTVSYVNNVEIGTATAMIRAAGNANYIGTLTATFNIGNNVGGFVVSGYAPTYPYTGNAITPAVVVESGSTRLQQGTDYSVSYSDNVNAGTASIIVKGAGKYTGTQTVNFIIEPRSIQVCETSQVEDKTYTGDAYTPSVVVKDSDKVLQNGVDYTLTYSDNVNPGLATITIQGMSDNYTGTKRVTFRIGGVAVSGLKVSAVNATSIKLKWDKQDYADGYVVCDSKANVVKRVNGSSATVTGLKPGKKYKYNVKSYTINSQGEESYGKPSSVVSVTTKLKTPTVKLKANGKGKMCISWTKSTNADGYEIYYKNSKGAKFRRIKKVNSVNTRICNVRGIKSGKKCYVRVRAFKKSGSTTLRSTMSKTKTIKVK